LNVGFYFANKIKNCNIYLENTLIQFNQDRQLIFPKKKSSLSKVEEWHWPEASFLFLKSFKFYLTICNKLILSLNVGFYFANKIKNCNIYLENTLIQFNQDGQLIFPKKKSSLSKVEEWSPEWHWPEASFLFLKSFKFYLTIWNTLI